MNKLFIAGFLLLTGCGTQTESAGTLHVAAASNLSRLFPSLAHACRNATGLVLVPTFGNTAQLAQQIENGGPYDLFLAADRVHVQNLKNVHNYAQGRLVLFAPRRQDIKDLNDLARPTVKKIGIAKPELAPYGAATVEALRNLNLWTAVEPKAVYGQNISAVRQFVDSSNVDAAFTALALVYDNPGHKVLIDPKLYAPLDQALGIPPGTSHLAEARRAAGWFVSKEAQAIFQAAGFGIAAQEPDSPQTTSPATVKPTVKQ
jgi:molybdate transport system substrate-binding protein